MASCSSQLTTAEISKVTNLVSADNSFRFCVEYLGIDRNEFKTTEYNTKFIHHDTLFECIQKWKNSVEGDGLDARQELINILSKVQEEQRWFSKQDMAVLFDEKTGKISQPSRFFIFNLSRGWHLKDLYIFQIPGFLAFSCL